MEEDSTWKEMERRISKNGFREGASDGHNSTFQAGFDEGFREGLRTGQTLGFQKGLAAINSSKNSAEEYANSNCQICEDNKLLDGDYTKLKNTQSMATAILETNLKLNISDT